MATRKETVDFILDQISGVGTLSTRKMFGEYALYCNHVIVAFICDDQLFLKPTSAGKAFIGKIDEKPPYPGAKNYFLISGDKCEDTDWISSLIKLTTEELSLSIPVKSK